MFIKVYSNNIQVFHLENWNFTFGTRPLEWCGYYVVFNETFRILSDKHHPHDGQTNRDKTQKCYIADTELGNNTIVKV